MNEKLDNIQGMIADLSTYQMTFSQAFESCIEKRNDMSHLLWLNEKISIELKMIFNEFDELTTYL